MTFASAATFRVELLPEHRVWEGCESVDLATAAAACDVITERPCGAKRSCGKCRVRVARGDVAARDDDRRLLGDALVSEGWRLGCAMELDRDAVIEIPLCGRTATHKSFGDDDAVPQSPRHPDEDAIAAARLQTATPLGLAIDVGSTTLAMALVEMETGHVLATASRLNPQVRYGADVVSRIRHAREHSRGLAELQASVAHSLDTLTAECLLASGAQRSHLATVACVGNPTMMHLLLGLSPTGLGESPYEGTLRAAWRGPARALGMAVPEWTRAYLPPPVRSHVGADAVAAMLATGLDEVDRPTLLIDLGTNSEVALATGGGMVGGITCTSTAAGPAFEGATIFHGMRAAPGAIDRVRVRPSGAIVTRTIGRRTAAGLCGSGLIDAAAELLGAGVVEPSGRVRSREELRRTVPSALAQRVVHIPGIGRAVQLTEPDAPAVFLTAADVRQLQLVKGSIAAAVRVLLDDAALTPADLDAVLIAGAFGSYVRKESALAIGLVPDVDPERVRFVGNAAGVGARLLAVDECARTRADRLAGEARYVELANRADYQDAFVGAMAFAAPAVVA